MILIIIFIFMVLLGFTLLHIQSNNYEVLDMLGAIFFAFGSIFLVISVTIIIVSHACVDHTIKKNQISYEGLCKRYEIVNSEYEDVSKSDVINDVTEWNMKVYSTKYWTENPWTNLFNPKKIVDNLYYIPLDEESEVRK